MTDPRRVVLRSTAGVPVAAVSAAVSSFLITVIAARALTRGTDAREYNEFIVFWSLLFCCYGIVVGLQHESTRAVRARELRRREGGARTLTVASALGGVVALAVAAISPVWVTRLLPLSMWFGVGAVAIGTLLYAWYITAVGGAAGSLSWGHYSGLMTIDALARLALVGAASLLASYRLPAIEVACVAATVICLAVLILPGFRAVRLTRTDRDFWSSIRASLFAMGSSAASALLVVGYPALVAISVGSPDPAILAATMTVTQLTRAPIMVPLLAFQSVAVAAFVARKHPGLRDLAMPLVLVSAVGIVGAPLAAWIGPVLLKLVYGPVYVVAPSTFAVLVGASVLIAMLTLTGTLALALEGHRGYMAGWLAAAVVAAAALHAPLPLTDVVMFSLVAGPCVGIVLHVIAIRWRLSARQRLLSEKVETAL